jgi:hypothetical protein
MYGMSGILNCAMIVLTIFVLLLAAQNGVQKYVVCLEALFSSYTEGIKILQLPQGSSTVCFFIHDIMASFHVA